MIDNSQNTDLFSPAQMGALQLPNRIVMAPVTRSRMAEVGCRMNCTPPITPSVQAQA